MARLVLIAHAATPATRLAAFGPADPLDAAGLAAASAVMVRRHDVAVCSPRPACVQTAAALGLSATIDPGLADCDFGRWQGRSLDDVAGAEPDGVRAWLEDPDAAPHGGESLHDLIARIRTWLPGVAVTKATTGTVVAVTHPAVVRAAIVVALTASARSFWRIDVSPLTETVLVGGGERWNLRITGRRLSLRELPDRELPGGRHD